MSRLPRIATIAVTGALALGIAACGDTEAPAEESSSSGGASVVTVAIPEFVFDPDPVELAVGDSLVWSNEHSQAHTATGTGAFDWDTGNIAAGEQAEPVEFTEAGTFTYRCALHPFMQGTVTVS